MPKLSGEVENVRVVVRIRPLSAEEVSNGFQSIVEADLINKSITVTKPNSSFQESSKTFTFDSVFGSESKQVDVYNEAARPIVDNVLEGYNGTIFAYGQTGTGKTFTMAGGPTPELKGIIPNSFAHIFGHIAKAEGNKNFLVRISYLEIYNEEVRDLLGKNFAQLEVKERPDIGVYVKDLSTYMIKNADDMDKIMTLGNKNRSVGETNMNAHSSRSHAIFTITIECSEKSPKGNTHVRMGKLNLVDLAGSERQSKTGATGQRLKEASKINLSLSTLGNVISALVDGKCTYVPYRNSKLTRLLQDSLGGNAKTVMCANIGPAAFNYDETFSTLRYANRAKNIKNRARINENPKDAMLRKFQQEIEELQKQLEESSSSEEYSQTDEGNNRSTEAKEKTRKQRLHDKQMKGIQAKIKAERRLLEEEKDMEEEKRNEVAKQLAKHEKELKKAQSEHDTLKLKLTAMEKKIIIGGVNLLEKAEQQERLLEESAQELMARRRTGLELMIALEIQEAERIDMEERYSSLQEEAIGKSRKLNHVWKLLQDAKEEVSDLQSEQQREMEGILDNIRLLNRELRLQNLFIEAYVPKEYQELIDQHAQWDEETGEWHLHCVAYTGNNYKKNTHSQRKGASRRAKKNRYLESEETEESRRFLSYSAGGARNQERPRTARSMLRRPSSSAGMRPPSRR